MKGVLRMLTDEFLNREYRGHVGLCRTDQSNASGMKRNSIITLSLKCMLLIQQRYSSLTFTILSKVIELFSFCDGVKTMIN